jgi:hypothetical protein
VQRRLLGGEELAPQLVEELDAVRRAVERLRQIVVRRLPEPAALVQEVAQLVADLLDQERVAARLAEDPVDAAVGVDVGEALDGPHDELARGALVEVAEPARRHADEAVRPVGAEAPRRVRRQHQDADLAQRVAGRAHEVEEVGRAPAGADAVLHALHLVDDREHRAVAERGVEPLQPAQVVGPARAVGRSLAEALGDRAEDEPVRVRAVLAAQALEVEGDQPCSVDRFPAGSRGLEPRSEEAGRDVAEGI